MSNPSGTITGRAWLMVLILFIVLPFLAFPEIVFGGQTLYRSDISLIHYPYHIMVAGEWLAGHVPLWNPYQHIGIPLLAEAQVSALYPLGLLFLSPLSPSLELSLFILIHFTLAALSACALARTLGMSWAPATVAGLAFGMGGFLMAQVANLNIMTGAAWLPLVLCAVILAVQRRSWLIAVLAGIPLTLQILTAQPQITLYTVITVLGYGLYRTVADLFFNRDQRKWDFGRGLLSGLLVVIAVSTGLLLAAPQILPSLELQQHSVRSQEMGLSFLTENSLPPVMGLNLLLPSAFGNNVVGFKGGDPFEEDFVYIGFLSLAFSFFCWGQWRKKNMLFFPLLLVGAVLLALGRFTPLYEYVIQYLPGFSLFRIPSRWLMVVNLALAIMAGYGMETLLQRGLSRSKLMAFLLAVLLIGVSLVLIRVFQADLLIHASTGVGNSFSRRLITAFLNKGFAIDPVYQDRLLLRWVIPLSAPAYLLMANLVVAALLFVLYALRRISPRTFSLLAIAAISVDLVAAGGTTVNPIRPDSWWHNLSGGAQYVMQHLEEGRVFPLGMGSEEAAVSKLGQFFPSAHQVHSAGGHGSPLMLARHHTFLHQAHPVQMVQLLGVRYILTEGRMGEDAEATYPLVHSDEQSVVYENRDPLPRAFIVHDAIRVDSPDEALTHFQDLDIDPRHTVILETDASAPAPAVSASAGNSTAIITQQNPQLVEIETSLADDGYLVLLDTYYPGWAATVDGGHTPIYRANFIERAVFVPAGEHVVRFEYRPLSFRVGVWISLLVLVVMAVLTLSRSADQKVL